MWLLAGHFSINFSGGHQFWANTARGWVGWVEGWGEWVGVEWEVKINSGHYGIHHIFHGQSELVCFSGGHMTELVVPPPLTRVTPPWLHIYIFVRTSLVFDTYSMSITSPLIVDDVLWTDCCSGRITNTKYIIIYNNNNYHNNNYQWRKRKTISMILHTIKINSSDWCT